MCVCVCVCVCVGIELRPMKVTSHVIECDARLHGKPMRSNHDAEQVVKRRRQHANRAKRLGRLCRLVCCRTLELLHAQQRISEWEWAVFGSWVGGGVGELESMQQPFALSEQPLSLGAHCQTSANDCPTGQCVGHLVDSTTVMWIAMAEAGSTRVSRQ